MFLLKLTTLGEQLHKQQTRISLGCGWMNKRACYINNI